MASGLENPFDANRIRANSTGFVHNEDCDSSSGGQNNKRSVFGNVFESGWQNAQNIALVVIMAICIAVLIGCFFGSYSIRWTHKGKKDKLRTNSLRGTIFGTIITLGIAISLIVIKQSYSCTFQSYYPYAYAVFGLSWRGAEIITAAVVARTVVEQLRFVRFSEPATNNVSRGLMAGLVITILPTIASYVLFVLWLAKGFKPRSVPYSARNYGNISANLGVGYHFAYAALSLAYLVVAIVSLRGREVFTVKIRRNLLLAATVLLAIRSIEQVAVVCILTFATPSSSAVIVADTFIYDLMTAGVFYSLVSLGKKEMTDPEQDSSRRNSLDHTQGGFIWTAPEVERDWNGQQEAKKAAQATSYPVY